MGFRKRTDPRKVVMIMKAPMMDRHEHTLSVTLSAWSWCSVKPISLSDDLGPRRLGGVGGAEVVVTRLTSSSEERRLESLNGPVTWTQKVQSDWGWGGWERGNQIFPIGKRSSSRIVAGRDQWGIRKVDGDRFLSLSLLPSLFFLFFLFSFWLLKEDWSIPLWSEMSDSFVLLYPFLLSKVELIQEEKYKQVLVLWGT